MFIAIHIPLLLCAFAYCGDAAAPPCDAQTAVVRLALEPRLNDNGSLVIVVSAETDDDGVHALNGGDDSDERNVIQQLPNVWIGVRVTPVPKPLATHIKREGLMIENVAKDSPADAAGLEQYDVIVSFDGVNIDDMNDLLGAISAAGAGGEVEMTLIRGGKTTSTTITPAKRTEMGELSFKYEEPEDADEDQLERYFGHRMKIGPGGGAFVMPHGRMELPDSIRDMLEQMPDFKWSDDLDLDDLNDLPELFDALDDLDLPFGMKIEIDADDDGRHGTMKHGTDERHEIDIQITEDGETIAIHVDKDGTIRVEREDADGNETSDTYENADALREHDADAYKIYRRFSAGRGQAPFLTQPDLKDLGLQRKKFEIELREALEKARKAHGGAHQAQRRFKGRRRGRRGAADDGARAETKSETVMMSLGDDGRITLQIDKDGVSKKYEFDNREDFEKSEPELYEKYGDVLEDAEGACGAAPRLALT